MMFAIFETNVATCLFETLVNAIALKLLKRNKSADKIYYMREVCWNEKHRFKSQTEQNQFDWWLHNNIPTWIHLTSGWLLKSLSIDN